MCCFLISPEESQSASYYMRSSTSKRIKNTSNLIDIFNCFSQFIRLQRAIMDLHQSGVHVPNTILIVNVEDEPICDRLQTGCKVPVFAMFKRKRRMEPQSEDKNESSELLFLPPDREILIPSFTQVWDQLIFYPWEAKHNTALLRASLQVRF